MKKLILIFAILVYGTIFCQDLEPGIDRWSIKTSVESHRTKNISLEALLEFESPNIDDVKQFDEVRMSDNIGSTNFKEGDIVVTKGWLHLVALEKNSKTHRDGDYHIQISNSAESGDNCFIVEIPLPDFIDDPTIKEKCAAAREFVKERLLEGNEPGTAGNIMNHEVYVQVRGQLFADLHHCKSNNRGKRGMKTTNCWEIHPVTDISFAVKPIN